MAKIIDMAEITLAIESRQRQLESACQAIFGLEQAVDYLGESVSNLAGRQIAIDDFSRIDAAQDKLALIIDKIQAARSRQIAKAVAEEFQHVIAGAAE
jgi:hypothetical protein